MALSSTPTHCLDIVRKPTLTRGLVAALKQWPTLPPNQSSALIPRRRIFPAGQTAPSHTNRKSPDCCQACKSCSTASDTTAAWRIAAPCSKQRGEGYADKMSGPDGWVKWFTGAADLMSQMQSHSDHAPGRIVEYHFAEKEVADWARQYARPYTNIVVFYTPRIVP